MKITNQDIRMFRQRAKTELKSGCDCGRLRWDDVVEALCNEVEKLRYTLDHSTLDHCFIHAKFYKFTEEALDAVNKIYDLVSKPCVVLEDIFQACQQARSILYNPPVTKTLLRNCERFETAEDANKEFNYLWNFVWKRGGGYVDEREYRGEYEKWLFAPIQEGETNGSR